MTFPPKKKKPKYPHILRESSQMTVGDTWRRFNKGGGNGSARVVMPFGGLLLNMARKLPAEKKKPKPEKQRKHRWSLTHEQITALRSENLKRGELLKMALRFKIPYGYATQVRHGYCYSEVAI